MQIGSLRSRLLLAAALAIAMALIVSAALIERLFLHHVEDRLAAELLTHLNQIAAGVEVASEGDASGTVDVTSTPADPRFFEPYSGLYWQLDSAGGSRRRSPSLWDVELVMPADELPNGDVHRHEVTGPKQARLFAVERSLMIAANATQIAFRVVVAVDRREIDDAGAQFHGTLTTSLLIVGAALISAFAALLHVGLRPLQRLHTSLQRVHDGERQSVEGQFPSEVQALVSDVNSLLEQQRRSVKRVREQASDLAHGFKTPLAVLSAVARDLAREGRHASAAEIAAQVDGMERHVRRELARARTAGASVVEHSGVAVAPVLEKVVSTMRRIAADRGLEWTVAGSPECVFAGDETDLLEIVGNLCENAAKWARTKVEVTVEPAAGIVDIRVRDDGPGIPAGAESEALARGKRLDESADGSGLGLSIVSKAVAAYRGRIELSRSSLGGLEARVLLPGVHGKLTVA